ncbi:hypothetical protein [Methanococcoides alaskense]|uniref:Uncharacterized protein n=1 Tax=Methanococcoides alaskense TaxID=325778 RepID=A0AA90U035_9EURY|nr:hypothetical protein [Methanococcoides alaskense]MDR6223473.1 hypothetical protein [Methanococcoides alaskense]
MQYMEHPEHKFDGDTGIHEREHVHADGVVYIGKEANNIDEQELDVKQAQVFVDEKLVYDFTLNFTPDAARDIGIKHRSALAYLKKKAKGGNLNFKSRNVKRIM